MLGLGRQRLHEVRFSSPARVPGHRHRAEEDAVDWCRRVQVGHRRTARVHKDGLWHLNLYNRENDQETGCLQYPLCQVVATGNDKVMSVTWE